MLRSIVILLALLILAGVAACGGSNVATPVTTTPAETAVISISPTPTPTAVPLPPPTPTPTPATAETGVSPQEESNSPRPGDEVFDFCKSDYGGHYTISEGINLDWTFDAYVKWSPDGSQILFSVTPVVAWGPAALYSVDPAGHSLQKLVPVPDFPEAMDSFSRADNGVLMRKIVDVPGRDPVWGDGGTMMYFDIFPDGTKIVYSTCAYGRGETGLEELEWEGFDWGLIRSIVVSDFNETKNVQRAEQGSSWVYNYEIVLSDIDGTNRMRLTKNSYYDNFPTVSPDGTKIAFISGPKRDYDGYGAEGERIVIHTVSTGKSKEIVLPERVEAIPLPLQWSPDGREIAFVARTYIRESRIWGFIVYVVGADGSGLTAITQAASGPAWHPDGERIAAVVPLGESREEVALFTFGTDGSDPVFISNNLPEPWDLRGPWLGDLSWSPDGSRLLLKHHGYGIPLNGSPPTYYGPPRFPYGEEPQFSSILDTSWSPDGSQIATRNLKNYQWEEKPGIVYVQDRDGTNIRSLVEAVEPFRENIIRLTNEE